jgi:hypothetical protein
MQLKILFSMLKILHHKIKEVQKVDHITSKVPKVIPLDWKYLVAGVLKGKSVPLQLL